MPIKILLADKSITIQKVVEMLFSGREYEIVSVSDGETALKEAQRILPDILLVDVDLPRIDGYALAAQFKTHTALAKIPVILMMSRDDVYDSAKGTEAGIVDKIAKPFESQELINKVKRSMAGSSPRQEESFPREYQPPKAAPAAPAELAEDIFDVINNAIPAFSGNKQDASAKEELIYEVEPVIETVEEPLGKEEPRVLPRGPKAVEEMRAGLGLSQQKEGLQPEIITFESLDMAREAEALFAPPKPAPGSSAEPATVSKEEVQALMEKKISTLAQEALQKMPPMPTPKISEELVARKIEEAVSKAVKEMARTIIEQVAWEVVPRLAEQMIQEEIERLKSES
ncbi:MAG: response regulator [Nitrospirota bacterium]